MTDPVEVIARAISGAPFPSVRSKAKARAALSALDAAGFAVAPKEVAEALKAARDQWNEKQNKDAFEVLGLAIDAMLSAAQVKP